jgi:hypothetical protein
VRAAGLVAVYRRIGTSLALLLDAALDSGG